MADEKDLEKDAENTTDGEDNTGSKDVQDGTEETGGVPEGDGTLEEGQTEEAQEEDAAPDDSKTASPGKKEKRFGKKKDKATQKLEEKIAGLEDQRVRQLAEFENFRKRSEKRNMCEVAMCGTPSWSCMSSPRMNR